MCVAAFSRNFMSSMIKKKGEESRKKSAFIYASPFSAAESRVEGTVISFNIFLDDEIRRRIHSKNVVILCGIPSALWILF